MRVVNTKSTHRVLFVSVEFRNFTYGEYSHTLRLTSELVELRAANANRILARWASARFENGDSSNKKAPDGCFFVGGATRNRTGDRGVADLCLTAWP